MKKQPNLIFLIIAGLVWAAPLTVQAAPLHHFDMQVPQDIELGRSTSIDIQAQDEAGHVSRMNMDALVEITNRNGTETQKIAIKNGKGKLVLLFENAADQGVVLLKISNEDNSIFNTASVRVRLPLKSGRGAR